MIKPWMAAVVALAVTLAGCSKEQDPQPGPTSATVTTESSSTSGTATTGATGTTDGPSATTGTRIAIDQSSPEAAMTTWLTAMLAGDKETVCALMASDGKAIADVPQAVETCSSMIGGMLDQLEPLADQFQGLTIQGATVSGDTASFERATTEPPMAAQIIQSFKAVRINGKWYVTQG